MLNFRLAIENLAQELVLKVKPLAWVNFDEGDNRISDLVSAQSHILTAHNSLKKDEEPPLARDHIRIARALVIPHLGANHPVIGSLNSANRVTTNSYGHAMDHLRDAHIGIDDHLKNSSETGQVSNEPQSSSPTSTALDRYTERLAGDVKLVHAHLGSAEYNLRNGRREYARTNINTAHNLMNNHLESSHPIMETLRRASESTHDSTPDQSLNFIGGARYGLDHITSSIQSSFSPKATQPPATPSYSDLEPTGNIPKSPSKFVSSYGQTAGEKNAAEASLQKFGVPIHTIHHAIIGPNSDPSWAVQHHSESYGNQLGINHDIKDENGDYVGHREFTLTHNPETKRYTGEKIPEHVSLYRNYFDLADKHRAKGISAGADKSIDLLANHIHEQTGLPVRTSIHANISVGGYAWARQGYDFTDDSERQSLASQMKNNLHHIQIGEDEKNKVRNEINELNRSKASANDFVNLDTGIRVPHSKFPEGIHAGKALSLGTDYHVHKWVGLPEKKDIKNSDDLTAHLVGENDNGNIHVIRKNGHSIAKVHGADNEEQALARHNIDWSTPIETPSSSSSDVTAHHIGTDVQGDNVHQIRQGNQILGHVYGAKGKDDAKYLYHSGDYVSEDTKNAIGSGSVVHNSIESISADDFVAKHIGRDQNGVSVHTIHDADSGYRRAIIHGALSHSQAIAWHVGNLQDADRQQSPNSSASNTNSNTGSTGISAHLLGSTERKNIIHEIRDNGVPIAHTWNARDVNEAIQLHKTGRSSVGPVPDIKERAASALEGFQPVFSWVNFNE